MGIGISFMPSAQGAMASPSAPQAGANTDLAQAFKILSLRLPQFTGGQTITPLAGTPGGTNTDALKSTNPYAAVFSALLQSLNGGLSGDQPINTTGITPTYASSAPTDPTAAAAPPMTPPTPSFVFKGAAPNTATTPSPTLPGTSPLGGGAGQGAQY